MLRPYPQIKTLGVALVLLLFCSLNVNASDNNKNPVLKLNVAMPQSVLLYQQDSIISLRLNNIGNSNIQTEVPPFDSSNPLIRLKNLDSQTSKIYIRHATPGAVKHTPFTLTAGDSFSTSFKLLDIVPTLKPGRYEMQVGWQYNNKNATYSSPVRFQVLATYPVHLHTEPAVGGRQDLLFAVWTSKPDTDNRSNIIRARINLQTNASISSLKKVGRCTSCRPVISTPAVGSVSPSQWIAWTENGHVYGVHIDDNLGVSKILKYESGNHSATIVEPVFIDTIKNTTKRSNGRMTLLVEENSPAEVSLKGFILNDNNIKQISYQRINGNKPLWIRNHINKQSESVILALQSQDHKLILKTFTQAEKNNDLLENTLQSWPMDFISAHSIITKNNKIYGAILAKRIDHEKSNKLTLIRWQLDATDFSYNARQLSWPDNEKLTSAKISIDDNGEVAILVATETLLQYLITRDGKIRKLPQNIKNSGKVLQLAFLEDNDELVLITTDPGKGLRLLKQDGSEFFHSSPKK